MAQYCAWHTYAITSSFQPITFANIPYLAGTPCDLGLQLNNDGTDTVVGTVSHELAETMTDPLLNAWQGSGGSSDEIGDKCAYQFIVGGSPGDVAGLPLQKPGTPSWYNAALGGRHYLLQTEFDNLANGGTGGCNQWDTQTQPKAAIAGLGWAAPGARASFSLTKVKAPAGIAYVTWSFGDGRAGSTTGTAGVSHTYQAAGKYTVTAIVTDNHGNEVKETKHMQVGPVHTLTVTRRGSGSGTIGSSPAGLSCGATCKLAFLSGAVVTLRAKATRGSRFAGWSGGCTGTTTCQVTMGTNKAVTATFEAIPPPSTTIMAAHIDRGSRKATFDFTGSGGVGRLHFECRLGSGGWSSCRSPKTYTGLKPGRHTFAVRAIDADGRADPSPKKHSFTV